MTAITGPTTVTILRNGPSDQRRKRGPTDTLSNDEQCAFLNQKTRSEEMNRTLLGLTDPYFTAAGTAVVFVSSHRMMLAPSWLSLSSSRT